MGSYELEVLDGDSSTKHGLTEDNVFTIGYKTGLSVDNLEEEEVLSKGVEFCKVRFQWEGSNEYLKDELLGIIRQQPASFLEGIINGFSARNPDKKEFLTLEGWLLEHLPHNINLKELTMENEAYDMETSVKLSLPKELSDIPNFSEALSKIEKMNPETAVEEEIWADWLHRNVTEYATVKWIKEKIEDLKINFISKYFIDNNEKPSVKRGKEIAESFKLNALLNVVKFIVERKENRLKEMERLSKVSSNLGVFNGDDIIRDKVLSLAKTLRSLGHIKKASSVLSILDNIQAEDY